MVETERKKMQDLISRVTSRFILKDELPEEANILTARFVLLTESAFDSQIKYKAKLVAGVHRENMKHNLMQTPQMLQTRSV